LAALPALAAVFAAGRVGFDQLRQVTRLHANERCRAHLPDAEPTLARSARQLTFADFVRVCDRFEAWADPDGGHGDHERCRRNRYATTVRIGHSHLLHAEGDALTGQVIEQILHAHVDAELDVDVAERKARYGDTASQHPLARTQRQRRYDALVMIFRKAAGLSPTSNLRPVVNIVTTETTLNAALGDYLSETVSGAPVDRRDLAIAALVGEVRRVRLDPAGRVTHLGRTSRLFTGGAREAVLLAFGDRCSWPGCDLHGGHIHIDHLSAWGALRGVTDPDNGGPICGGHNRHKHRNGTTVTRDHTGWHHFRQDGTEIAPRDGP
jgi:uncharacterized protein DUF222